MPVREQRDIAVGRAGPGYHPIDPRTHLFRRLATRTPVPEDQPACSALVDLLWGQALVLAVIPLGEVGVDDGFSAEPGQSAGLTRPLHRAAEDEDERFFGEHRPHP